MQNNCAPVDRLSPFVTPESTSDLFAEHAFYKSGEMGGTPEEMLLYVGESPIGICTKLDYTGLGLDSPNKALNWLKLRAENFYKLPFAVICDVALPEEGLKELVEYINTDTRLQETPVLFYSKNEKQEEIEKAIRLKADDLFFDLDNVEDIIFRINSVMKIKKLERSCSISVDEASTFKKNKFSLKRTIDVTVSCAALLALSPIMLLIALAIRLESKGGVFYVAPRAGFDYKVFNLYKFRTMIPNADKKLKELIETHNQYGESDSAFVKFKGDPRVTKLGSFLRKTSLDELPQLINVLKGDMSLVGNRPLPLYEAEQLTKDECVERFLAPAGITGLWQVKKRGKGDMSARERIELDRFYAQNNSIKMDFWIMSKTIPAMLQKEDV